MSFNLNDYEKLGKVYNYKYVHEYAHKETKLKLIVKKYAPIDISGDKTYDTFRDEVNNYEILKNHNLDHLFIPILHINHEERYIVMPKGLELQKIYSYVHVLAIFQTMLQHYITLLKNNIIYSDLKTSNMVFY